MSVQVSWPDTTGGVAFASADGVVGCATGDSPRECVIGEKKLADVGRLLAQPPA